jgi:hypothetical protein
MSETETIIAYAAKDRDGRHCLVTFTAAELAKHPQLATDANFRQRYLANDPRGLILYEGQTTKHKTGT